MEEKPKHYSRRLVLLLWILVAVFYFYLSYDYIRVGMNDGAFGEYIQHVVQLAGVEGQSPQNVRTLIFIRAQELDVPVQREEIAVVGSRQALKVDVNYSVDIEIPVLDRAVYTKTFNHQVMYERR